MKLWKKNNKMKTIIHLRHPAIPKTKFQFLHLAGWKYLAKRNTLCWTSITENMKVTDDISKVTCKKCFKIYAKQKGKDKAK